jgi:hypothetical protein
MKDYRAVQLVMVLRAFAFSYTFEVSIFVSQNRCFALYLEIRGAVTFHSLVFY